MELYSFHAKLHLKVTETLFNEIWSGCNSEETSATCC